MATLIDRMAETEAHLKTLGLGRYDFYKRIPMAPSTWMRIKNGTHSPTMATIEKMEKQMAWVESQLPASRRKKDGSKHHRRRSRNAPENAQP